MKWALAIVVGSIVFVAAAAAIGARLPRTHKASRTLRSSRSPADVFAAIENAMKSSDVPVDVLERDAPHRMVTRVRETERMFGGTWTVTITPEPTGGSALTIVEDGWVENPIFRVMAKYVFGHHATMDGMLEKTAKTLGEEPVVSGE